MIHEHKSLDKLKQGVYNPILRLDSREEGLKNPTAPAAVTGFRTEGGRETVFKAKQPLYLRVWEGSLKIPGVGRPIEL